MNIKFGTDGWRAVIAEEFTFANVARVAQATADYWIANPVAGTQQSVVVGYDRRFLSDRFAQTTAEVMAGNGFSVVLTPTPTPTPSVSQAVRDRHAVGGVMITASHNPPIFNGFKLKSHYGGSSDSETCQGVESFVDRKRVKSVALAEAVNAEWAAEGLQRSLDIGRVITIAVVHDLAESLLTDLPKRSTQLLGKEAKHAAEAEAMRVILEPLHNGEEYLRLWEEYNSAASPEARLVRDADKLEMMHQALVYERAGNRSLQEFWEAGDWQYAVSQRLYADLRRERRAA